MKADARAIAQAKKKAEEEAKKKAEEEEANAQAKKKEEERMQRLRPLIEKANQDAEKVKQKYAFFAAKKAGTYIPKK